MQIGKRLFNFLREEQRKEMIQFLIGGMCLDFTEIQILNLYFCLENRIVKVSNQIVKLTAKEFDILALLIMHPKRVFTYEMIMDLVWHEDYTFYSRKAVNNHVSNLRKKLKIAPDIPDYIKSVYGVGYKFEV
jgi:DNA-binding response OmpR family regulator